MGRLIKAEFLKLSKSMGYKVLLLCDFVLCAITGLFMMDIEMGMPDGYSSFMSALVDTQVVMTFSVIFASVFICNEFANRTFSISLFSGCSRRKILLSKIIVFLIGILPFILIEPFVTGTMVTISKGFGDFDSQILAELIQTTFLFILGGLAIGSICAMLAVLIKNIGGTIGAGLGIMLVMELLPIAPKAEFLAKLMVSYQIKLLPNMESYGQFLAVTIATFVVTLVASVFIFKKAELK